MVSQDIIWWITAVDIPALAGLLTLIWQTRRECKREIDALERSLDQRLDGLKEAIGVFQLDVAKTYASEGDVGALESRLVAHLLRIEAKLDATALKAEAAAVSLKKDDC